MNVCSGLTIHVATNHGEACPMSGLAILAPAQWNWHVIYCLILSISVETRADRAVQDSAVSQPGVPCPDKAGSISYTSISTSCCSSCLVWLRGRLLSDIHTCFTPFPLYRLYLLYFFIHLSFINIICNTNWMDMYFYFFIIFICFLIVSF